MERGKVTLSSIDLSQDLELLLAWRSHPKIYKWFYEQEKPLEWQDHYNFWHNKENRKDWLIKYKDRKVGSTNIVGVNTEAPDVGIYVGEITLWGSGVGTQALKLTLSWLRDNNYNKSQARISKQNIASQRLFEKVGFLRKKSWDENENWWLYIIDM